MKVKTRNWLVELRNEHKLTQQEVAEKAGISKSYYAGIERGWRTGTLGTLVGISKALEFPVERFYEELERSDENES